ncbi:MAG: pilus assembly protein TadG-related protein [Hyphomicrobium sp.]
MHRPLIYFSRRFGSDESGNVAIVFGLASTAILLAVGIAIDFARTTNMNTRIAAAADSATLAAGRAMLDGKLSDADVEQLAKSYVHTNANSGGGTLFGSYAEPVVTLDREHGSVKVDVGVSVPTTAARISGINKLDVPVVSAAVFGQSDVEVAMALDVTGSMTEYGPDGQRKIDSMKKAFKKFVGDLLPEHMPDGHKVRIAVAPYSSGVNLGKYAKRASGSRSKDGCVIERTSNVATDYAVGPGAYFKVHEDQPQDKDNTEGRQDYTCPNAEIIPLTDKRQTLIDAVGNYRASGSTSGHMGLQWAWNLISPNWQDFWGGDSRPDPYERTLPEGNEAPKLIKAVILMSDGIFNTSFYNGNSASQATTLCDNIKTSIPNGEVLVFSIAFGNPPAQAKRTLEQCATPGAQYYADAADGKDLEAALSSFANTLNKLRLTQ